MSGDEVILRASRGWYTLALTGDWYLLQCAVCDRLERTTDREAVILRGCRPSTAEQILRHAVRAG